MGAKQAGVVAAIRIQCPGLKNGLPKTGNTFNILLSFLLLIPFLGTSQETSYQKRILESTEIDLLSSYYSQEGNNAAVSGGMGDEHLTDATGAIVINIPLNDDDILTIDAGVSAYTSASSSNVNPFDGSRSADPFVASSGASRSDEWINFTGSYTHNSDDRNAIWSANISVAKEFDYSSLGGGGSYTRLFNEKNTEVSVSGKVYIDRWKAIYPFELRPFGENGARLNDLFFAVHTITGNPDYSPVFSEFEKRGRNSYSAGLNLSQILSKNMQVSLGLDVIEQRGLLSTPFQRIYFGDIEDSFIENFQLADAIEKLPDSRTKIALGGRLNYYLNATFVLRTYYRYYFDDWGIRSHTASLEIPIKLSDQFTLYPSYRFYAQTASDYFAVYEAHVSSEAFYTSDYDLSKYMANQYGLGITYTDILTRLRLWKVNLKSIDLKYNTYDRDTGLNASIISLGAKFLVE